VEDVVKLNIGSGPNRIEGYLNIDAYAHTADVKADALSYQYPECDEILSRHMFEHFGFADSFALLVKWTLALKVGGLLVIEVPDVAEIVARMYNGDVKTQASAMRLIYGSQEAGWALHINGWAPDWMRKVLEDFGYSGFCYKQTVSGGDLFPNCAVEYRAIKGECLQREQLINKGRELLGYYCHPSEVLLHQHFCNHFLRKV
jgi:hypothetical protein